MTQLSDYGSIAGEEVVSQLSRLAERLAPRTLMHINSTRVGGGVAEMLERSVPLFNLVRPRDPLGGHPGGRGLL